MLFDLCLEMDICKGFSFLVMPPPVTARDADAGSKCRWRTLTFDVDVCERKWIFLKKVPPKVVPPLKVLAQGEREL